MRFVLRFSLIYDCNSLCEFLFVFAMITLEFSRVLFLLRFVILLGFVVLLMFGNLWFRFYKDVVLVSFGQTVFSGVVLIVHFRVVLGFLCWRVWVRCVF